MRTLVDTTRDARLSAASTPFARSAQGIDGSARVTPPQTSRTERACLSLQKSPYTNTEAF